MAEIRLQEGEPLENALRRFKRKVQAEDIIKEVKRHSYYLKPGEKRRVSRRWRANARRRRCARTVIPALIAADLRWTSSLRARPAGRAEVSCLEASEAALI